MTRAVRSRRVTSVEVVPAAPLCSKLYQLEAEIVRVRRVQVLTLVAGAVFGVSIGMLLILGAL